MISPNHTSVPPPTPKNAAEGITASLLIPCFPHSLHIPLYHPLLSPLIPLPRRLRTRTPRHTPLIPPTLPQPLLRAQLQLPLQLGARILAMYEVAEAAAHAALARVQAAARLAEVGHGRELAVDGARGVPPAVERVAGLLRRVLVLEARVHVADQICLGLGQYPLPPRLAENVGGGGNSRSLLLSQTTTSSSSPYLHISHQKSS